MPAREQAAAAKKIGRDLCRTDLFYLLTRVCGRADIDNDFLFARCCEVQAQPDGMLDLWAREHYKSTIITFGKTIQDILINPEVTIGIFSHTKPIARSFLAQIKFEMETNEQLKFLFSDILYQEPRKDAPKDGRSWSLEKGITVRRTRNPRENTVEAYGLVDGQPTSKHYDIMVFDDVVTLESVTSPEMIEKTTVALAISLNLGANKDGIPGPKRYIGTRYHFNDTYRKVMERKTAIPRIHPATDNGKVDGEPVFLSQAVLDQKMRDMGSFVFACQMLQNPKAGDVGGFVEEDLRYYDREPPLEDMNFYILVDPANSKTKKSDYTAMWVVGLGRDRNYYIYEIVRDRLSLTERTDLLFDLHQQYLPLGVGYEQYGMQADLAHIDFVKDLRNYHFEITPVGGKTSKNDRISSSLIPLFEAHRMWLPRVHYRRNYKGEKENLINIFVKNEYIPFPVMDHDDMLDSLARVRAPELAACFPVPQRRKRKKSWREKLSKHLMGEVVPRPPGSMAA